MFDHIARRFVLLQLILQIPEALRGFGYFNVQFAVLIIVRIELVFITPFLSRAAYCRIVPKQI